MWLVGAALIALIVGGSYLTLQQGKYTAVQWFDLAVFGLAQGSVYALIALGYTLVYGILRMINFAHSEIFMSGAFIGYFAATGMQRSGFMQENPLLGIVIIFLTAMTTSAVLAILLERIAYRPLRGAPRLVPLITAIGASFFLQYTFRGLFGTQNRAYPEIEVIKGTVPLFGDFQIQKIQIIVIIAAAVMMAFLALFVQYTKTGKAMRAVSEDKSVAALMGIDVDAIIVRTFILGASLAGAAGVLYCFMFRIVTFYMGFIPGIKAFTAAVLGGIGNPPGAMLGGLFLGIFESLGPTLFLDGLGIPAPYQLKDVIAFTMLVMVLIFRPTGILGERLSRAKA
ncbi:MAG: branched-chain amino acid ABC transporter permease [Chloroflexi bacterium]|nr:branched-chain amino acid ABC transporter permease [Chloroflexota bacterium]MDL1943355.1 branched-chain amino acid ABC transporter permease [Chloroflexi bacterium CFX2]